MCEIQSCLGRELLAISNFAFRPDVRDSEDTQGSANKKQDSKYPAVASECFAESDSSRNWERAPCMFCKQGPTPVVFSGLPVHRTIPTPHSEEGERSYRREGLALS